MRSAAENAGTSRTSRDVDPGLDLRGDETIRVKRAWNEAVSTGRS